MKDIYDYKHVAGTKAIALLRDGKMAGKIAVYAGAGNVREAFEAAGYTYLEVL